MGFIVKCTHYTIFIIQFVAKSLYNLWLFYYTICGFACYGSASCLIERHIEVPRLQYVKYKSAIEVNFIAFGLHYLEAVRERKNGIGMLLRNSYTAYIQYFELYWIAALSD